MLFALLEVIQSQRHRFMPPQAAREQQCEQCSVAFSLQSLMIGCLPECGAEETAVGGFVCEPTHGTETG